MTLTRAKSNDSREMCRSQRGGTGVASLKSPVRSFFYALAPLLMSCLVTDKIELPEEQPFPPSIVSPPDAVGLSLDEIIQLDRDTAPTELAIPVIVRDPNVDQELELRFSLDPSDPRSNFDVITQANNNTIIANGTIERSLTLRIPTSRLALGCRKLELLVSAGFNEFEPRIMGDIDQAVWWVRVVDAANPSVDLGSCN